MPQKFNPFAEIEQQISAPPSESELSSNPIKDTGIKLAQGAIDLGDSLVGVADLATGGLANVGLDKLGYDPSTAKEILGRGLSGKQKLADQRVSEAEGFVDTLGTALQNPRSITGAITQSAPLMVGGMAVTGAAARKIAQKAAAPYGGMSTEAGRKAAEEAVKANTGKLIGTGAATEGAQVSGLIASEAEREGRDYTDYALPAVGAGVTTALIGKAGGKLAGDAATDIVAKTGGTTGNFITKVGKSGAVEAAEEGLQSPQETIFSNIAMGEEDVLDGVGENAAMGLLAGGGMGITLGALQNIPTDPYDALLKKGAEDLTGQSATQTTATQPATDQPVAEPVPAAEAETETAVDPVKPEIKLNSKKQPYKDEQSAIRAAAVAKEKDGTTYEPTPYEDGYALKPVEALSDEVRIKSVQSSDRVSKLKKQLNDFQSGIGDQAVQEALDSGMDEAQSIKYLRDRQKEVKEKALAGMTRKDDAPALIPDELQKPVTTKPVEAVETNEQQAQTQTTQENAGEAPRDPAITETFADDNGLTANDKLILARDKLKRAEDAGDEVGQARYQSLVDKYVAEVSEPAKPAEPAKPVSNEQSPKLPSDIAKAKPRYSYGKKSFTLAFDNDVDRAAYIAAQSRPSKRDADYVKFVADNTGMAEADIRSYGQQVRDSIKAQAKDAEPGQLVIPNMRSSQAEAPNISSEAPNIAADPVPVADVNDNTAVDINQDIETPAVSNSGFTPTHELPNGTPVVAVDGEENVYRDESGDEWEDDNAIPVKATDKPAIAVAANEAATSPENDLPEPTEAQKEAGNYKVGRVKVAGLDISVENPKGSKRKGVDRDGKKWENEINHHYGYIRGTVGRDKDHVDVFLGDDADTADRAYVIDQVHPDTGKFDEHKVMIGFKSADDAKKAYLSNYDKNWKGFNGITDMPMADFKEWVKDPVKTNRPASAAVSSALAAKIESDKPAKPKSEAPEHAQVGVDDRELGEIVAEFNEAAESMRDGDDQVHHLFDKPAKSEIVRLQNKVKVYHKEHGWMTPAEAKQVIAAWKENAISQGKTRENSDRVVLSLFDLTGKWSQPWEEAGYEVYRFDIQNDPDMGDINNFSTEFFQDWFGDFDGKDIYAVLAACPCTDFASSGSRHFAAKDADGRTVASVKLVQQTLAAIEYFRPAVWAVENPVGRIEKLGGLPPWRLSFDPNHIGDPYTKKTLLWGRFNGDMPIAPVEPTEGSKMHTQYGGKSLATKNARSATPEGFAYGFFMANNAIDHPVMAVANKYDRLDRQVIADAIEAGMTEKEISHVVDDFYYMDLDDRGAENALREAIAESESSADVGTELTYDQASKRKNLQQRINNLASEPSYPRRDIKAKPLRKAIDNSGLPENLKQELLADLAKAQRADQSTNGQENKPVTNQGDKSDKPDLQEADNADSQETDQPKSIGKNMDGVSLYEDAKGVRYYIDNGARISEKVRIQPTRDGVKTTPSDRAEGYKTVREIEAEQAAAQKESKPASPEFEKAKADMDKALGDLGEIFLSANLFAKKAQPTELNASDLMPVLTRVMDAAFRMGYASFKDNARFVLNTIRDRFGDAAADSIDVDNLQGAYIGMKKGSDTKLAVISVESIDEIMQGDSQDVTDVATIESAVPVEENDNDTGRNDQQNETPLDDVSPESSEELEAGGLYETSLSGGRPDEDGDGQPDPDRTGRSDGVDGGQNDVLHGTAAESESLANSPNGRNSDRPNKLAGENPGNFVITDALKLGEGTTKQKIDGNLNAIRTLQKVESEGRFPTAAEQQVMAKYVGWGGLSAVFDNKKADATDMYGKAQRELKQLLSTEEYRAAISSTRNAHYTAKPIVEAMWQAVQHFGFKGGRVLEPTVGTGNFIGMQPENLAASSQWFASELDSVTGRITKLLYPEGTVLAGTGFQDAGFANGVFDLAIGNPPFGSETIRDKSKARNHLDGMKIHNYVIAKSGLHLRPGGVMSMVVTHRFLDTANPEARDVLAKDFKFLGAIRLPNDAFMKNAGTEVTTDIIFLQKRHAADTSKSDESWLDIEGAIQGDDGSIRVNKYFEKNPSHILGRSAMDGTMYAGGRKEGGEYTVHSDGRDLNQAISDIINNDWADMAGIMQPTETDTEVTQVMLTQSDLPVGGMTLNAEGKVIRRDMDDDNGNAVIETITPETLWKNQAEQLNEIAKTFDQVKASNGTVSEGQIEGLRESIKFAYYANGEKKAKPTKAEQAIYDIVDAIESGTTSPWKMDEQLDTIKAALNNKLLGRKDYDKLRAMLDIRNRTLALINAEFNDANNIESLRVELNKAYDKFVKSYGYISEKQNINLLAGDLGVEVGLEADFTDKVTAEQAKKAGVKPSAATAEKATMLKKRVNFPHKEITSASDSKDALHISLSERGKVDLGYMAKLTGQPVKDVISDLSSGDSPEIFFDPESGEYDHADAYLSGNVKHKLQVALENDLPANIEALKAVQPEPKTKDAIVPTIRSAWIPKSIFTDFLNDLGLRGEALVVESIGRITSGEMAGELSELGVQFRDDDAKVNAIFDAAAAGKTINIYRKDFNGNSTKDEAATKRVGALVERIAKVFNQWAYSDENRANTIVEAYNEKMNTHRKREFDGVRYLRTVGASSEIKLRNTQKNAAWRMIQSANTLLDHVVGAGKTYTVVTGIMERRRLGLSKKPMVAVPNHLVVQWASEWYQLYPGAKLLAATPDDFAKSNRRRLFARIATGDYDAIIIGHSSLGMIEAPANDSEMIINEKIDQLQEAMDEAKASGDSERTVKQMGKRIDKLKEKLQELLERKTDQMGIDFATMGVDFLAVDEAHEFKNLQYATAGERVVGMNDPNGSKRALHLYTLVRGLQERKGGVTFATGTPLSNSLVELYTMMSYLATDELKLRNQSHFDAWSGAFTQTSVKLEYTATQKLKPRRVLSGLMNLDGLRQLYEQFADIITMNDLKRLYAQEVAERNKLNGTNERTEFPVPKVKNGGRQLDIGDATESQTIYTDYLVARMQVIESKGGDKEYPKIDNALNVLTDARKMSLDIRTVDPESERDHNGKVARAAANIMQLYDKWSADKGAQLVFSDMSTPAKTATKDAERLVKATIEKLYGKSKVKAKLQQLEAMTYQEKWVQLMREAETVLEDLDDTAREKLEDYLNGIEDADGALITADTGFSVYDDLRDLLIEKGMPANEIAFIHDYNTPEQKRELFGRVNDGKIRVLLGSTPKMGAGTNAQKRLVALHHMDAPWRPSDVEQREGRIIRQGNMLYQRDPDGFEVEIIAYSTKGTSDTVMWQILERKASAIEQFREGGLDRMEEEGADSDQYAEFMASSTGNPVFKLKMEAERRALELQAEIGGMQIAKANAARFMANFESRKLKLESERDAYTDAVVDEASFAGETGTAEEFEAVLAQAMDDYATAYAKYIEKKHAIEEQYETAMAAGKSLDDLPNMPTAPSKPTVARKSIQEKSGYARAVFNFLASSPDIPLGRVSTMKIGDVDIIMERGMSALSKTESRYKLSMERNGERIEIYGSTMKDPSASEKMLKALAPKALAERVKEIPTERDEWLASLNTRAASEAKRADLSVDTTAVDDANELADWYRMQVAFAEVKADRERASRPNKYIQQDTRRPLGQFKEEGDSTKYDFDFEGVIYSGTGISRNGLYDAVRKDDGKPVVVKVSEVKDGSPVVESVTVEPKRAAIEMEAALSDAQALSSLARSGESIENGLNMPSALKILNGNKLLARLIKSGKLKVQRDSSGRQGAYSNGTASVFANANTADGIEATAWHEVTHAAMDLAGSDFINQKVKTKLFADLKRQVERVKAGSNNELMSRAIARTEYAGTPDNQYLEEIAAYLVTEYISDESVAAGSLLTWIKDMVSALKIAVLRHTGLMIGSISASDMKAIATAYASFVTGTNPTPPRGSRTTDNATSLASSDTLYSTAMPSIEQIRATIEQSELKDDLKKPFERLWQGLKSQSFGALTLRQLGEVAISVLPAINRQYIPTKDKMVVEISKWMELGGKIATDRQKLKKPDNQLLSDVQHEATLAGVDPSQEYKPRMTEELLEKLKAKKLESIKGGDGKMSEKKFAELKELENTLKEEPARKEAYDRLVVEYGKLSVSAKGIYARERDYHKAMNTERLKVLTERIENMPMAASSRKDLLNALQEKFESFEVAAPYFPLSRYGEFWVFAEQGDDRTFNMFETDNERQRFTEQLKKEGYNIIGTGKHLEGMQQLDGVSSAFVTEVDQLVSQLGDSPTITNIRKEIYDLYLQSLPDLSARKHFIRRKKTKGFDLDQARAFADAVEHGSRDIGRLKFADRLREIITNMEATLKNAESTRVAEELQADIDRLADYLENAADLTTPSIAARLNAARGKNKEQAELWKERLTIRKTMSRADVEREIFRLREIQKEAERLRGVGNLSFAAYAMDEIRKSHTALLNPNTHPVAQALNSFGFFWFLGLTPAAAFVNLTQTAVIAMPLIGAKFGYGRANKLLSEATKAFFSKGAEKGFSVLNSKLSRDERAAFDIFYSEGLIDNTLAHDTAGISENGLNNGSMRHKLMDAASFMFHHAERMNREVTALATYRAARDAGMDHEAAIAEASDVVWHGHFDYTTANRARFLRGNVMRVVTQFKQYSQNMIYLYGRLGYQAFKGSDIEKAEARKALTGIIAMQFGLAGAAGLPLAGLFAGVAQLLADVGGDDDEPFMVEAELRAAVTRALSDVLGDDAGRFASHAMSQGIVNALTPLNLSGRISHSDMLIRMSDREISGRDAAYDTMKALGGVATSYIEMPFVAIEHLRNENYSKAAETMLPKFARDIVKGMRFGVEDARTARGYLFKDMSFTEVAAQMVGFSSSELADQYGQNNARTNLENRLKGRRSEIIDQMVQARKGDRSLAQARREMDEWNEKHPTNRVTMKNIMQSEKGRQRYEDNMNDGRYTTKRYQDVAERFDWNN